MRTIRRRGCELIGRVWTRSSVLVVSALTVLAPAVAMAQVEAPPQPSLKRYPQPWIGLLAMFVLATLVIVVSLIPSKRGHQD